MIDLDDILAIEGEAETEEDYYLAIQRAINAGSWSLQGSFGRTMMDAIKSGRCLLGRNRARDYWGNFIPSRDDVKPGTPGSAQYVEDNFGADWRELMEQA